MDSRKFIELMHLAERLKDTPRHSWTSQGRRESVAEHSWRLALMAVFLKDDFPEADWEKVLTMAVLHDMGECFTGDIPAFEKTDEDRRTEYERLRAWCASLPQPYDAQTASLFQEMEELKTLESRIVKALDKMEAMIQHNEADISTWLPLEYDLNLTYGEAQAAFSDKMKQLRREIKLETIEKMRAEGVKAKTGAET